MDNLSANMHNNIKPLAEKMRPKSLDDFVGQQHILGKGKLLRRLIECKKIPSVIFFGPPGTDKTTLAQIIADNTGANFVKLNAVSSGVADAKIVIEEARKNFEMFGKITYLLLDEIHRWSKTQVMHFSVALRLDIFY
ncbi:MAG: AAA family ATPase [Christensenellaceae bacterium]|jgi:putative ATPase|nr:AAA family ATPase [Christensenellaceae bacterium]